MLPLLAVFLLLLGLTLLLLSYGQRQRSGLPQGKIIYTDTGEWRRNDQPLFSNRYRLAGKPDYLVQSGREIIPVEVKSTRLRGRAPYESHKLQLAAYCLLVEDVMGVRPSHGLLKYADAIIRMDYTDDLRNQLLNTLSEMRDAAGKPAIHRSHEDATRCRFCGFRHGCDDKLTNQ